MAFDIIRGKQVEGNWAMGAPIFTTSEDAKQKWNSLLQATNNLNDDVSLYFKRHKDDEEAANFARQWSTWRDTIYSEYKDNAKRKIIPDLAWNVWNRGDAKLVELKEWRDKFEKISGQTATAPNTPRPEEQHETKKPGMGAWGYLAIALAGAVGLTLVQRRVG